MLIFRQTSELCGIVALYLALESTLLTKTQLKQYDDTGMRKFIGQRLHLSSVHEQTDFDLLKQYFECKREKWLVDHVQLFSGSCGKNPGTSFPKISNYNKNETLLSQDDTINVPCTYQTIYR